MATVEIVNATLQIWGSLISILIGICLYLIGRFRVYSGRLYLVMLILNTCSMLFDVASIFLQGIDGQSVHVILWIVNTAAFSCNVLLIPTFIHYLLIYLQNHKAKVTYRSFTVISIVSLLMLLALVVNLFYPFVFFIGPDNVYYRSRFHILGIVGGLIGPLCAVYLVIKHRHVLSSWERVALLSYILIPIAAIPLQEVLYGLALVTTGNVLSLTMIYLCFQIQQAQQIAQQENALIQNRYTTAFSQIQPHFMFNALNIIQYLCKTDPQEASRAICCFAKYLRVNMDSLTCTRPVPLEEDLAHLENYLSLQRLRFPDIQFEYHLETTDFLVPLLTLQPLVDNAIRHGVRQLSEGGTISISSWEDTYSYRLEVRDNGGGFPENQPEDGENHLGITNTRIRIERMCHGQMQVTSQAGLGVTVQIRIPKEKHGVFISGR